MTVSGAKARRRNALIMWISHLKGPKATIYARDVTLAWELSAFDREEMAKWLPVQMLEDNPDLELLCPLYPERTGTTGGDE